MLELFQKRSQKTGLSPGSFVHIGYKRAEEVKITVINYDSEKFEELRPESVAECARFKDLPSVTWINVDGLHDVKLIEEIGNYYGLHPLTIEDILNTGQRSKLDVFEQHIYIVVKMHRYNPASRGIETEQVSLILGQDFLLTFQELAGDSFDPVRSRLRNGKGRIRKLGADYLGYALLDSIVDQYFTVLENVGEEIEDLEMGLVKNQEPATLQRIQFHKREMLLLRKSIWPLRELISSLQREDDITFISDSIDIYIKDLYDHTIQVIDTIEIFRDILSGMIDIYMSSINNRMNEIMKVLTIYAAIFIPLTLVAGIYGMNFDTAKSPFNMPELGWYFGYPFALGIMLVIGVSMAVYFKIKKWF